MKKTETNVETLNVKATELLALQSVTSPNATTALGYFNNKILNVIGTLDQILGINSDFGSYRLHARPSNVIGCTAEYIPNTGWAGCLGYFNTASDFTTACVPATAAVAFNQATTVVDGVVKVVGTGFVLTNSALHDNGSYLVSDSLIAAPNTLAPYADVVTGKDRRVAIWGASQEGSCSATNFQFEKRVTDAVVSALHTAGGWWKWFQCYFGCPLTLVYNGGVAAYTTAQTTAKFVGDVTTGARGTVVNTGTGNGTVTFVGTKLTLNETITLTFSSATAFTVTGSLSGSLGAGTVGTLFGSATTRVSFTATAGATAWVSGDTVAFQTFMPFTDFDIAVFRFGPNDFPNGTTFAAIKADVDTAITLALNLGKRVHVIIPYLRNPSAVPVIEYQNLRAYTQTLVATNSRISMTDLLGFFSDSPIPLVYVPSDGMHANIAGLIFSAPAFQSLALLAGVFDKPRSAHTVGKVVFRFDGSYTFSGNGSLVGAKSQDANGKDRWLVVGTGVSDAIWLNFPAGLLTAGKRYKLWADFEVLQAVPVNNGNYPFPCAAVRDANSASVFDGYVHGVFAGDQIPAGTRHQGSFVEFLAGTALAAGGSLRFYPGTLGYQTYLYEVCVVEVG